ncbi:TRAP transporter small permease subunit [Aliiglaciecola sp. CAU 1673]|uniref:TRAP transporter small permease subunit n=1 Tax=Aliiglaciecola sp. CAU 1673 TaxID=3032595 RepID=UPI0023DA1860|nr:TRAP transporter small permease subunit [Aliiglaciecola sp. CAU 1673]MDF2176787.1 TRAP transporter small permease subunit [Aliiglaciecola sp. CAU 1673]
MSIAACRQVIDSANGYLAKGVSWLTLLMAILVFTIVLLRYGFNLGWIAMQESVMYLHAMVFLLGAAHTLKVDEHVRVDILYRRMSMRGRAWVDLLGTLVLLVPLCVFILISSWDYVASSWRLLEGSPEAGGLPLVYFLKSLLPLFAITLLLQGVAQAISSVLLLLSEESA